MRHRKSGKKLGRTWEHRKAMFRNMAKSLITHEKIKTTFPKAKELSKIVDKLITLAIRNDLSSRRQAYKVLGNHSLVKRLFDEIGPKFSHAGGGYTRVVKFATPRVGDSASMAVIEFAYPETEQKESVQSTKQIPAPVAKDSQESEPAASEAPASDASVPEPATDPQTEPSQSATEQDLQESSQPEELKTQESEESSDNEQESDKPQDTLTGEQEEPKTQDSEETEKKI
ncbi:50S ribosomal protein L17 [Desulfonatronovibrio magnus]|uniref:50S ribosomal protein L17 n=1 Tax=Desulfonatronovibrio magnus TaxID=698827 RepID=UPI000A024DBC|nr:50S ribosomal protein L17 [Desulfonatronovibrio magnus]